jgi:hypothetical protein
LPVLRNSPDASQAIEKLWVPYSGNRASASIASSDEPEGNAAESSTATSARASRTIVSRERHMRKEELEALRSDGGDELGGGLQTQAFQPLLRRLRLPADEVDDLLGDLITEDLSRIAAGAFDGDSDALFARTRAVGLRSRSPALSQTTAQPIRIDSSTSSPNGVDM